MARRQRCRRCGCTAITIRCGPRRWWPACMPRTPRTVRARRWWISATTRTMHIGWWAIAMACRSGGLLSRRFLRASGCLRACSIGSMILRRRRRVVLLLSTRSTLFRLWMKLGVTVIATSCISILAGLLLCRIRGLGRGRKVVIIRCRLPLLIARSRVQRLAGCMPLTTPLYGGRGLRRRRILVLRRQLGLLMIGALLLAGIDCFDLPSRRLLFGCLGLWPFLVLAFVPFLDLLVVY